MDHVEFSAYYKAIDILEAQEMLINIKVSDYPHVNDESRSDLYYSLDKKAYPTERKVLTTKELAQKLGMING